MPYRDADLLTALQCGALIGQVVRPLSDAQNGQTRDAALLPQFLRPENQLLCQSGGGRTAF